jgi:Uma2 family endonuclease
MSMAASIYYTAEMVRALPDDGNRYETVHGELLATPAPRAWHQLVLARLFRALDAYLQKAPVGHALWSPADISWSADTLVQPDLFVVPTHELRALDWAHIKHLLLVVEVLSPTTARGDRFTKRRLYQEMRAPAYWIVDADQHFVEVWTPEAALPTVEREQLKWLPAGAGDPFVLRVPELFRPL